MLAVPLYLKVFSTLRNVFKGIVRLFLLYFTVFWSLKPALRASGFVHKGGGKRWNQGGFFHLSSLTWTVHVLDSAVVDV